MELKNFATTIAAKNNFIKASFGGFAGSGKSTTASDFIIGAYRELGLKKPILFIDNEKGSRFLIPKFKKAGIECLLKDTVELADVLMAFEYLQKGEIDFLFIDSLTKVWYKYVRGYREKNKKVFMTLQDWGKILPAWQEEFSDRFVNIDGNIVFTGRGGYTYEMEENDETKKKEFVKSGVKMKMAGETPFEPDMNIWMEACQDIIDGRPTMWREAVILKDRSSLIDGKTFKNPTYKDFQPVVKYLINVPKGEVIGATEKTNLAPRENLDAMERRDMREIELEKIKNLFDKYGFGTSKEDKQLKVIITEKCFGTSSGAELEKRNHENLRDCRVKLEQILQEISGMTGDKISFINNYNF